VCVCARACMRGRACLCARLFAQAYICVHRQVFNLEIPKTEVCTHEFKGEFEACCMLLEVAALHAQIKAFDSLILCS